jgi:hypothetical protein
VTRLAPVVSSTTMTCGENRGQRCCRELRLTARGKAVARQPYRHRGDTFGQRRPRAASDRASLGPRRADSAVRAGF